MQLKHVAKLFVQISPMSGHARSAREFLARATSRKSFESNPQCEILTNVRHKGDNFVEVTFNTKATERIYTKGLTVDDIMGEINAVAEAMDMQEVLSRKMR